MQSEQGARFLPYIYFLPISNENSIAHVTASSHSYLKMSHRVFWCPIKMRLGVTHLFFCFLIMLAGKDLI